MKQLLLIMVLPVVILGCGTQEKQPLSIQVSDLNGEKIALEDIKDKAVFMNFWATWCAPCIREMPSMQRMEEALKDEPITFFYASDESVDKILEFKEKKGFSFNYVHADNFNDLNIYALPTTFILNDQGEVIFKEIGSRVWDSPESIEEIKHLLHQK